MISSREILFVFLAVGGSVIFLCTRSSAPPRHLQQWARGHGCRILHFERRAWSRGPFTREILSRSDAVYRLQVRDFEGRERSGWILFSGLLQEKTTVHWDAAPVHS